MIAFCMICVTASSCQTTFYVDPNFTGTRNGSASNPWQSLNDTGAWSAINTALANGPATVYFSARQPGSNTPEISTIQINLSQRTNTSTNVLTLDGISQYNTNSATPSWTTNATPVACLGSSCAWYTAPKFTIQATTPLFGSTTPSNCPGFFTVQGFSFQATEGQSADATYLHDLTFQYNEATRIATGSYGPGVIVGPANAGPCGAGGSPGGPDNLTVQYNYIHATWGECIYVGASTPDPWSSAGAGEDLEYHNLALTCGVNCNTGQNYIIKGNIIESCASWGGQGDGIDVKDGHANLQLINNTIRTTKACSSCGLQAPGNDGQGIVLESGSLVDGNYVESPYHQCFPTFSGWNNGAGRGSITYRNNMCINANSGIGTNTGFHWYAAQSCSAPAYMPSCGGGSTVSPWSSVTYYSNNVYIAAGCFVVDSGNAAGGTNIENNVCSSSTSGGITAAAGELGTHDYNDFYNITGTTISYAGSFNCPSISASEPHSLCTDPQFVSTSTPYRDVNFMLQTGSPVATAGIDLFALFTDDYFGYIRSIPWSMGAAAVDTTGTVAPPSNLSATAK